MRRVFVYEFLSGGGAELPELRPAGIAMRDAIVADLRALPDVAVTCAQSPAAPAPAGVATTAPRPGEPADAFVARLAACHDLAWVVAPETGGVLAALHDAVGAARWIGCDAAAIRVCASKRATLAALAGHGVPTPHDVSAGSASRWVVKPDDGAGSSDTRLHADETSARADVAQRRRAGQDATLEPWVDGEALSISLLAGAGPAAAVSFNRQEIDLMPDGTLAWRGLRRHAFDPMRDRRAPGLHALAAAVVRAIPGLRGFVGIDLVWHPVRGPVAIEVNPRVTCAYVGLSATLHRNLAGDVLARHARPESLHAAA